MHRPALSLALSAAALLTTAAHATQVRIDTPLGGFTIQLYDDAAPGTVLNFLNYIADGDYEDSFFHRSAPGFVVQGGGFTFSDSGVGAVPTDAPIANEFGASNTRGTVAMAKLGGDPNSATSQWFVNLADNSSNLDAQNGGFTVFAQVMGDGMDIVDAIAALAIVNASGGNPNSPFGAVPVQDTFAPPNITRADVVMTTLRVVGDATGDAYVGIDDLDILLANWGSGASAFDFAAGDFDGDGSIGQGDLDILNTQWGQGLVPGATVPEPTSAVLVLGGVLACAFRRRSA